MIGNLLKYMYAKNYQNREGFDEAIIIIIIIYYKIVHEVQHHTNITYQDVQIKSIA